MIERITPIWLEWNWINGFNFEILGIECNNSRCLFGISLGWRSYFYLDICYFRFKLYDKII